MDSQVQNDPTMQYGHMALQDRRDSNLDTNGSSSFHQNGLGQALGSHLTAGVGPAGAYSRSTTDYRNPSTSPPTLAQQPVAAGHAAAAPSSHSPLTFTTVQAAGSGTSPVAKRKQIDSNMNAQMSKRRRSENTGGADDGDNNFDMDGGAQGAKHWTDEEKSKLFSWLMGPGQEEHWNALRATKNSCLRECAIQVFGGKKTYQALKGCYERNFNLFKQIYAFENAHGQGGANIAALSEADRLREYERRLQIARKAGSDVGNITARTIDHWHRVGWYDLFYRRWHGDPATMRPVQARNSNVPSSGMAGGTDDAGPEDEDTTIDFGDPSSLGGLGGVSHDRQPVYINPQDLRDHPQSLPPTGPTAGPSTMRPPTLAPQQQQQQQQQQPLPPPPPPHQHHGQPHMLPPLAPPDPSLMTFGVTQDLLSRCLNFLSLQTKLAQERLDILRRREARELNDWNAKRDAEKSAMIKDKLTKAFELANNSHVDPALRQAATEYLKKLYLQD